MTILNKHHQFTLGIFSICLVILLSLSTVNRTIHDGLFHSNFATETGTIPDGCSGNHEGPCQSGESNSQSQGCDASCPVNVFENGILAFDFIPQITTKTYIQSEVVKSYLIAEFSEEENGNLVRGPPEEKKV